MNKDLTKGNIGKSLIMFSLPMIGGNILQQAYNIADTLIVGKTIGSAALAAVGSSYTLMVFLTSIIIGLTMGSGIVFAQIYGANRMDELKKAIVNSFIFMLLISLIINVVSFKLIDDIIRWMNIQPQVVEYTKTYLNIVFLGIVPTYLTNYFSSILRSVGNSVVPLIFLAISAIINIILDLVFILVLKIGVAGAAWATLIAQVFSAMATCTYFFIKEKRFLPQKEHYVFDFKLLKFIISNSVLTSVQQSIMNFGILMIQGLVNSFGVMVSAAFAIVVKIDALAYLPVQDFGNAFSLFVAQNFGAEKKERIRSAFKKALAISSVFSIVASIFVNIYSVGLISLFIDPSERETISIGVQYLRIEGAFYIGIGILFLLYGIYRGLAKPSTSIKLTIISLGTRVVLAYFLSSFPSIGVLGIWWSIPIGWLLADTFGLVYYKLKVQKTLMD